ncbi:MAG: SgcJ/EcaC family oxidoreductase [Candidatus Solibacter usitatus]|nr:SgcJ/EcaC family oxidoreductase [Candidatus Solibacter usitatus]
MFEHFEAGRGRGPLFCGVLTLFLLGAGCDHRTPADTRAADEAAIRETDAQWAKAAAARDLESTVSYYTDDASLLPPNEPIASGRQAIRAAWAPLLGPDVSVSWQVSKVEVARSGDLGYVVGTYVLTTKDGRGKAITDRGKMIEVWKKQTDGKWKAVADIFNSDLPQPAPPEEKK